MRTTCLFCGKGFDVKPSRSTYNRGKYCSRDCKYKADRVPDSDVLNRIAIDENGCHIYQGARNQFGYGRVSTSRITGVQLAHRFFWLRKKGEIPDGLFVLHRCDKPACCNVDHLYLGTRADNIKDMMEKDRSRCFGHTKRFTHQTRRDIAQRRINGESPGLLAKEFGISYEYVRYLVKRFSKELTPQLEDLTAIL